MEEKLEGLLKKSNQNNSEEDINRILKEITLPYDKQKGLLSKLDSTEIGEVAFIDGLFRSGTTLILKLLRDSDLNALELYHIVCYDQLLYNHEEGRESIARKSLDEVLNFMGAQTREYDKIKVDSSTVDEYCHLIAPEENPGKNLISRVRYGLSYEKRHRVNEDNKDKFIEVIKKIRLVSNNDNPIVLKNPFDYPNVDYIHQILPEAKHIFIRRFPPRAIASLFKALRTDYVRDEPVPYLYLINDYYRNTFEDPLVKGVIKYSSKTRLSIPVLTFRAANEVRQGIKNRKLLPKENYLITSYKKLTDKPNETIDSVLEILNVKNSHPDFREEIKKRSYKIPFFIKVFNPLIELLFRDYHSSD